MLLGLRQMHARKVLHRDFKTLNVFLDEGLNVKLGDLGVAKVGRPAGGPEGVAKVGRPPAARRRAGRENPAAIHQHKRWPSLGTPAAHSHSQHA